MPKLPSWPRLRWTIKGRIAFAFLAMSTVSVALGELTITGSNTAARLVRLTYDEVLISNSYARATANDFANLRANFAQTQLTGGRHDRIDPIGSSLQSSFEADLATAVENPLSPEVATLANALRQSEAAWLAASRPIGAKTGAAAFDDLDKKARTVEDNIEALVSVVADRGYAYRTQAQATVDRDVALMLASVAASVGIAGFIALMLYWRISAPIGVAGRFARQIAAGNLQGDPPVHGRDEIGELIGAMVSMRGEIAAMVGEQVVLREQGQARVAEALEGSREGVIIVDPHGTIQIANGRALDYLGILPGRNFAGASLQDLVAAMDRTDEARAALLRMRGNAPETEETLLSDGRWLRNSRYRTTEGGLLCLYTDITGIKDQQDRLAEANLTLDAALGNMSQGLCLFDEHDRLKLANSQFQALFALPPESCVPGASYRDIVAQVLVGAGANRDVELARIMRNEAAVIRRRRNVTRSIALGSRTIAIVQQPMAEGGWLATYEDITERKRAEAQIAFLANHDALTHLPNRTMLARRVEEAIGKARRGTSFAVLCIDLDHFKQVNDTRGHALGDQLLRAVTDRLLGCVRESDTVARLGGDEFAILQTEVAAPEQVADLAQRVVEALDAPYMIDGHAINISASVGIALSPSDGLTHGVLLKSADAALYKAKEDGRRTWRFFELAMDETLQARHALEVDLRNAIQNEEFLVYYQPLLDTAAGQISSFEALVRWQHPTRGFVLPDQFIPVAEETGAIKEIGRWVLEAACREAMRWPGHMRVAVNVSTIQLRDAEFATHVTDALAASGLAPNRLELEVTESVFMANTTRIMPVLTALREIGVRFAMDDFGTGYSSLSTLRAFSFDKIKIDRSFVRDMSAADTAGQIIKTILALGRTLGMRVTAEGVETQAQLHFLTAEGCDEIQGYLLGRPMPAAEILERLARDADRGWLDRAA